MKTYRIIITSLLVSLIMVSANASTTYKWLDENGNVVYSQQPPKEGPYETIKTKNSSKTGISSTTPSSSFATEVKKENEEQNLDRKVEQEAAKSEKLRADNCKAAKNNLETYTVYRRIKNDQGEIIRLDDNERAKRIQEAKDAIKEFCD